MANYLYNGIELPQLPDWDKETYPYAIISSDIAGTYFLQVGSEPFYHIGDNEWGYTDTFPAFTNYWFESSFMTDWLYYNGGSSASRNPKWANYDLYKSDGTLYLPATAPIPVSTATTWKYNGVELPALPEVDLTEFSFVFMYHRSSSVLPGYYLYFGKEIHHEAIINGQWHVGFQNGYESYVCYDSEPTTWQGATQDQTGEILVCQPSEVTWSNFNVLNEDGSVFLALSSPVPVSSVSAAQANFLMGMQLGNIIARNRKPSVPVYPPVTGDVLDNELPIEWNSLAVANNTKIINPEDPTNGFVKISNLVPTVADFQSVAINVSADGDVFTLKYSTAENYGNVTAVLYVADTGYGFAVLACSEAGENAELGVTFPSTGLYVTDVSLTDPGISIDFKAVDANNRTVIQISSDSVTEDSVTGIFEGDLGYTMLKVSDIVMTAEQIGESSILADGLTFDTVSDYITEKDNPYILIQSGDGYTGFANLFWWILSISDTSAMEGKFPETGTYVLAIGGEVYKLALTEES